MEIENSIRTATATRGIKRSEAIDRTATLFYNFLKNTNYNEFNKSLFASFMPEGIKERTKQRIQKEVFKLLIDNGNITKTTKEKKFISLRNRPLRSCDFGSYKLLMAKNGYSVGYYKYIYDYTDKIPRKIKVGNSRINENFDGEHDISELISHKPRNKQAVYTLSPFSVCREVEKREVVLYRVN
jgi:hypothetical protein